MKLAGGMLVKKRPLHVCMCLELWKLKLWNKSFMPSEFGHYNVSVLCKKAQSGTINELTVLAGELQLFYRTNSWGIWPGFCTGTDLMFGSHLLYG